jgi:hypothetical protein
MDGLQGSQSKTAESVHPFPAIVLANAIGAFVERSDSCGTVENECCHRATFIRGAAAVE